MTGNIVIVGSGCTGLYTAYLLTKLGYGSNITIVAKHMPGDTSLDYPSPVAGANFAGLFVGITEKAMALQHFSYKLLNQLVSEFGNDHTAGLACYPQVDLFSSRPPQKLIDMLKAFVDDYEEITDKDYLAEHGAVFGQRYKGFCFYSPNTLKFLKKHLESKGVQFIRRELMNLNEALTLHSQRPSAVFNCTGLLASKLVKDSSANYPIRGQIVIVRAPHIRQSMNLDIAGEEPTYIIPRPYSNGRVVLGGYYQKGVWSSDTKGEWTESILERTTRLLPELVKYGPLEVLEERSGLRPGRDGGVRIEKSDLDGVPLIHNYGAGGCGWFAGLGQAVEAINLYLPTTSLTSRL